MSERLIVLDTETTGLNCSLGDRVIEIGCVELAGRKITDKYFHTYLNPEREIAAGAAQVHGLTAEFLSDKPRFAEIGAGFVDYIRGADLIIHNAGFDCEFLDAELERVSLGSIARIAGRVIDTLALARELHPGRRNSLDALCERYGIANAHRTLHGALLDAHLLAEVYLAMTRGQDSLVMESETPAESYADAIRLDASSLVVLRASDEELAEHDRLLDGIDKVSGGSLWRRAAPGLAGETAGNPETKR